VKHLLAVSSAVVLGICAPAITLAAVVPVDAMREASSELRISVAEVRWVRRCRLVRVWRFGRFVSEERCKWVWIDPAVTR
jgi:hypothetical protein